jgi:hypothetical protein
MGGEASRVNGRKGGHPYRTAEQCALKMACKQLTPELLKRAKHIAFHGETEAIQLNAIALLMAHGHGKPPQPVQGPEGGAMVLQVTTGVNTPADFGNWKDEG